jgi:uncharacterized protein YdeI (YjbR/CyaY-like superfamily)
VTRARTAPEAPNPHFFASRTDWRSWLEANHDAATEVIVGFHRIGSGVASITWPEAVDQALCFGWIDSIRRRIDETTYSNRFTPRRPGSTWSAVNVARVAELTAQGLMREAGLRAFAERRADRIAVYAHEQEGEPSLPQEFAARLEADALAWEYFQTRPPWYRRNAIRWVVDAKRDDTRARRMAQLIADSAAGRPVPPLRRS